MIITRQKLWKAPLESLVRLAKALRIRGCACGEVEEDMAEAMEAGWAATGRPTGADMLAVRAPRGKPGSGRSVCLQPGESVGKP